MNLDILNKLTDKLEKNSELKELLNNLERALENIIQGSNVDMIEQEYQISLVSKNKIRNEKNKILKQYGVNKIEELDSTLKKVVEEKINQLTERIIKEQNEEIEDYRKEGHIYLITEDTNGRIFLSDQTQSRGFEIEEVDFPKELKDEIVEGDTVIYKNGSYKIY